jgi:hypothetical protein
VFNADIAACFDSLDDSLLLRFLEEKIPEPAILDLIQSWLETGVLEVDGEVQVQRNRLSRLWQQGSRWLNRQFGASTQVAEEGLYLDNTDLDSVIESQTLWQRARSDLLLLGLAGIRPTARRLPALMRHLARRKGIVLGITGALGVAGLAGFWWGLQQLGPDGQGALQGGALSPLLANVYLHHFDKPLVEHDRRLVRYADDFVVCCESQGEAENLTGEVAHLLSDLRLRLNLEKTRVANFERGFRFLGRQFHGNKVTPPPHYRENMLSSLKNRSE